MSIIKITANKRTASATFLPYKAYKSAHELALKYEGTIGKTEEGFFKAEFKSAKTAKQFVADWEAAYTANRKVEAEAPKDKPSKKATTKGKGKGKGNGFDFDSVKGKTKSEKNKALHAMLVGMGIADSRKPEYMNVWNARPWAK